MAYNFWKSSLTSKMGNAWAKRYFCISSFSLLYTLVCLSCPGLAWKYPNINYIRLHYITLHYIIYAPFFRVKFPYSGVSIRQIRIFSISPTFRRTMGVQKHLFVIEHNVIKELLKLKTNARSFTKLFFIANYVEMITCAT